MIRRGPPVVDWAVASRAHPDQVESGDRHLVAPFRAGLLLAAVDGLGHGSEAALAACTALEVLEAHRAEPVVELVRRCHKALAATRGAVMSLASVDALARTLSWIGVGNVEGVLLRANPGANPPRQTLLLRGGVVGYQMPGLRAALLRIAPGDTLILATDGIRSDFATHLDPAAPPRQIADCILSEHGRTPDDALVLVARFPRAAR